MYSVIIDHQAYIYGVDTLPSCAFPICRGMRGRCCT